MSKPRIRYEKVDFIKFTPIGFYDVPKEEIPAEEEPSTPEVSEPSTSSVQDASTSDNWNGVACYSNDPIMRRINRIAMKKQSLESKFFSKQVRLNDKVVKIDASQRLVEVPHCSLKRPQLVQNEKMSAIEEFRRNCFRNFEMGISTDIATGDLKKFILQCKIHTDAVKRRIENKAAKCIPLMDFKDSPFETIPLGPTACHQLNQKLIKKGKYDYRFKSCLSNSNNPLVLLKVKTKGEQRDNVDEILEDLRITDVINTVFDFSCPGVPYYMEMRYGEDVKLVLNQDQSRFAIIVERVYSKAHLDDHFSKKFCQKVKARKMSSIEVKEFCRKSVEYDQMLLKSDGYVITFKNSESKRQARCREQLRDTGFIVDGAIDYSRSYDSISLEISHNKTHILSKYGVVVIANWFELEFAQRVFNEHQILCKFVNSNNRFDEDAKYRQENDTIFIHQLPKWVNTDEYLQWFVNRILEPNGIETKKVEFWKTSAKNRRNRNDSDEDADGYFEEYSPIDVLNRRLVWTCSESGLWNGPRVALVHKRSTDTIARGTRLWVVDTLPVKDSCPYEQRLAARFPEKTYRMGLYAAEKFVEGLARSPQYIVFNKNEYYGPRIAPRIRKVFPVSKNIRISFDSTIRLLDEELRNRVKETQISEGELFNYSLYELDFLKIVEFFRDDESEGFIGIEGWKEENVILAAIQLESLLQPVCLDCVEESCEELLYGLGEAYARTVLKNLGERVVADFDRFQRKIHVYGCDAKIAIESMKMFKTIKNKLRIKAEIMFNGSYLNRELIQFFDTSFVHKIARDLGGYCIVHPASVEFEGYLAAFELFQAIINDANTHSYMKRACDLPNHVRLPKCPVCLNEVNTDFYRLEACGHAYCTQCINGMIRNAIDDRRIPCKCCFDECDKFVAPIDFRHLILGDANRVKSLDSQKLATLCNRSIVSVLLTSEGKLKACPTPDCVGIFCSEESADEGSSKTGLSQCYKCEKEYCKKCLCRPHEDQTCEEHQILRNNAELSLASFVKLHAADIHRCPKTSCKAIIMKMEGCNHMECSICKTHFCWICAFVADTAPDIYSHLKNVHGSFVGGVQVIDENILNFNGI